MNTTKVFLVVEYDRVARKVTHHVTLGTVIWVDISMALIL